MRRHHAGLPAFYRGFTATDAVQACGRKKIRAELKPQSTWPRAGNIRHAALALHRHLCHDPERFSPRGVACALTVNAIDFTVRYPHFFGPYIHMTDDLIPVSSNSVKLGEPIPFSIYDKRGTLLIKAGVVIANQKQIDRIIAEGLCFSEREIASKRSLAENKKVEIISVFETVENIKLRLNRIFFDLEHANLKVEVFERLDAVAGALQDACERDTDSALASLHLDYDSSYGVVHHLQAALLCELIGKRLGVKDAERRVLVKAALTHDIGLHDIQNTLDRQVEPLSELQKERIKTHPDDSVRLLAKMGVADIVWLNVVLHHHERIDGSGYPSGCKGDEISVPARILAVADIYSAMVRDRPYRKAMVSKDAMRHLLTDQGKTIDWRITQLMIKEVGVFPPGSTIKLSTGEIAVVKERGTNTAFPVTYAFVRPDGMPRLSPVRRETNNSNCVIEGLVPFSKYRAATSIIRGLWRAKVA